MAAAAVVVVATSALVTASALAPVRSLAVGVFQEPEQHGAFDARRGSVQPSAAQRADVSHLGAEATWNRFGTPQSLIQPGGWLATGLDGSPADVAREFVRRNADLYRLSPAAADDLEVVSDSRLTGTDAHVVLLRQRFGGLPAVADGSISVGVEGGKVAYASATLGGDAVLSGDVRMTAQEAWLRAAASVGRSIPAGGIRPLGEENSFDTLEVPGLAVAQHVRLVALPTPRDGVRRAYEANVVDTEGEPIAYTVFVDAETGEILRRVDRLDHVADEPRWKYFTNHPPLDSSDDTDRRILGCFPESATAPLQAGCQFDERSTAAAAPTPWDKIGTAAPTLMTSGNNADTALSSLSPFAPGTDRSVRPSSPTRNYIAPWTDSWQDSKCSPSVFAGGIVPASGPDTFGGTNANDVNAAIISLFANHNRLHDWSYNLGFTEANYNLQQNNFGKGGLGGDPMLGDAQANARAGTPTYSGRDSANQAANITLQDGQSPTNIMYLWQPIAGAYYPQCVDADFDMSVIAHEYAHTISNRMVGGPDEGLTSSNDGQARALGESFSDLTAVEYLMEYGYAPADDEDPFTVGAYITGNKTEGIRNYSMAHSPLNYSNVQGYDGSGTQSPHDDGEIWSAVNYDIRQALVAKYNANYPAGNQALQLSCADGQTPVDQCPGNRRWMQFVFNAYLLMQSRDSMLDARDAYLAADMLLFDEANRNQSELWTAFARRGFGENASSTDPGSPGSFGPTDDPDPVPSFESPLRSDESTLTFNPKAADEAGAPVQAELFVGEYEAGVTPVADTDPATPLGNTVKLVPGRYSFVVRADGYGTQKFERDIPASSGVTLDVAMRTNRASAAKGATAGGEGTNHNQLIDDTEGTNWTVANRTPDVGGASVTVDLAGGQQLVEGVNVSAFLSGRDNGDEQDEVGNQNRFTALRQFEIHTCAASDANQQCGDANTFTKIYTSPPDAFPGDEPRPVAPDLALQTFDVPDTSATHVRMVVVSNQCTGSAVFRDNTLDNDPDSNSSCRIGNTSGVARTDQTVRAAELQVFSQPLDRDGDGVPDERDACPTVAANTANGCPPDTTPPETRITSGPSGTVNTTSARFSFSSEAGATFECRRDGAAFSACTSPKSYTALTNGRHTFSVRARDGAGNVDATPASRTWTVDTIKPTVVPISPRHASITRDTTPTIKATVRDNLTNLQKSNIKLYVSGTLVPATRYSYSASTDVLLYNSPRLTLGKKTVKIVATDAARNVGVKSWYFTIR
jgi:hypothetical protein